MRNPCKECDYYHSENNTCQSKKCCTSGSGYITWIDRLFCKPYKYNADRKTEPTISKMEQVDKDINVRSKTEPQTERSE